MPPSVTFHRFQPDKNRALLSARTTIALLQSVAKRKGIEAAELTLAANGVPIVSKPSKQLYTMAEEHKTLALLREGVAAEGIAYPR
jgi:hypothetical protein